MLASMVNREYKWANSLYSNKLLMWHISQTVEQVPLHLIMV